MTWPVVIAILTLAGITAFLRKSRSNYMALPEPPAVDTPPAGDVTVIIPARNEERNIADCVRCFAGYPVLVVDDSSSDRTAAAAQSAGARVIAAPPISGMSRGKPNACAAGAAHSVTPYLLFVDADVRLSARFLPAALRYLKEHRCDMVTAFLRRETCTWSEKVLLPYAFGLYFTGVNTRRVQDENSSECLANGQCILIRREAYEKIGGHRSVLNSVIEDVELARVLKTHRLRMRVLRADHLGHVRMYDSLAAIWRGFKKNSFRFLQANKRTGAQVILASMLLTSVLPLAIWLSFQGHFALAAALLLAVPLLFRPWYGRTSAAFLALPAIYLFHCIAIDGMVSTLLGLRTTWKGREV